MGCPPVVMGAKAMEIAQQLTKKYARLWRMKDLIFPRAKKELHEDIAWALADIRICNHLKI